MPRQELNDLLDRLNREMASLDDLDDDARAKLEGLKNDIADRLDTSDSETSTETRLAEPVQAAIDDFEKTHPALTLTLGRIMDILSKMGI